jgi:hypothetical protein
MVLMLPVEWAVLGGADLGLGSRDSAAGKHSLVACPLRLAAAVNVD